MVENYSASLPGTSVTGCSLTAFSVNITCAGGAFTSGNVGNSIYPSTASVGTIPTWLDTTIATVTGATTITVATAPAVTETVTALVYPRDSNITIKGGNWLRTGSGSGIYAPLQLRLFYPAQARGQCLHRGRGQKTVASPNGVGFINIGDVTNVVEERVHPAYIRESPATVSI